MPLQRFEAATLEEALEAARREAGADATLVEANRVRRGGVGGFFAKEHVEVAVEVPEGMVTAGAAPDLLALVEAADATEAATLSTEQSSFHELVLRLAAEQAPAPTPAPAPAPAPAPVSAPAPAPRPVLGTKARQIERETIPRTAEVDLTRVGLPAAFTVDLAAESPDQAVLRALQSLPRHEPLPVAPGSVVAVVGERDAALALARSIADELGLDPAEVALAAEDDDGTGLAPGCLLPSVAAVAEARWTARYQPRPSVVAVAAPLARGASSWARRALEALDPTATWAHADAARKPEDVLEWSERLGGVDAVAVDGVDGTASPAAILATGIPVARVDGRRSTPALWAAIITERLAA